MELQDPDNANNAENPNPDPGNVEYFGDDLDSSCSTPYVSAPSSPGRGNFGVGFFYSAPASPMHFAMLSLSKQSSTDSPSLSKSGSFEFEFSARYVSSGSGSTGSMSSADELFHNGQIRPMKLSSHLESPQVLAPLLDLEAEEDDDGEFEAGRPGRGRDSRLRGGSVHRRARSMSPMRNVPFLWIEDEDKDGASCSAHKESSEKANGSSINGEDDSNKAEETTPSVSASSSRSSSAGRSSKRWVFLKEFLHSKSEGRSNNKFWSTISFSLAGKEKKSGSPNLGTSVSKEKCMHMNMPPPEKLKGVGAQGSGKKPAAGKPANGLRKRRVPLSAHELHYTANRAQAEELRKKTYLPYRQGLLGCLGFSSKGYGAINGFARALNPVSSR